MSINSCTLSRDKRVSSSSSFNFVSSSTPQSNAVNRARSYLRVEAVMMALAREEARGGEGGGRRGGGYCKSSLLDGSNTLLPDRCARASSKLAAFTTATLIYTMNNASFVQS